MRALGELLAALLQLLSPKKQQSYKEALNISLVAQTNCIDDDSRCNALIAHVEPFSRPLKHMRVHSPRDSSAVSPLAVDLTLTT